MMQGVSNERIRGDFDTVLKWLGVSAEELDISDIDISNGFDNLSEADKERWRKAHNAHEKFAAGFEKYLMEGKAPAPELRSAFESFKRWLRSIYTILRNITYTDANGNRVAFEINDEIRGVMDRLLSTESEAAISKSEEASAGFRSELSRQGFTSGVRRITRRTAMRV